MNFTKAIIVIALAYAYSVGVQAQELTPRAYWPAPKGTQLLSLGYSYVHGDSVPDITLPVTGLDSRIHSMHIGYLQTMSLWGRTANFVINVPYSDGDTVGACVWCLNDQPVPQTSRRREVP